MMKRNKPNPQTKQKKKLRRRAMVCSSMSTVILLFLILTYVPFGIPRLFGYHVFTVLTGSMSPAIPAGSLVYVRSVAPEQVSAQDVISFQSGSAVITHRVVENHTIEGTFTTKGDANSEEDMNPVAYDDLIGVVRMHIPVLGMVSDIYTSTLGKIYAFGFLIAAIMMQMLARRFREIAASSTQLENLEN